MLSGLPYSVLAVAPIKCLDFFGAALIQGRRLIGGVSKRQVEETGRRDKVEETGSASGCSLFHTFTIFRSRAHVLRILFSY